MSKDAGASYVTSTMSSSLFSSAPPSPRHSSPPALSSDSITPITEKRDPIKSFMKPFLKRGSTHAIDSIKDHLKIGIYKPSSHHYSPSQSNQHRHPHRQHQHHSSISSSNLDPALDPHPPTASSRVVSLSTLKTFKSKPNLVSKTQPTSELPPQEPLQELSQDLASESTNRRHGKAQTLHKLSRARHSAVLKLQAISSLSHKDPPPSTSQSSRPSTSSPPSTALSTLHEPDPSSPIGSDFYSNQNDHPVQSTDPSTMPPCHPLNLTVPSSTRNFNSFVSMTSSIHSLLTQPALVTLAQLAPAQLLSGVHSSCFGSSDAFRGFDECEFIRPSSDSQQYKPSDDPSRHTSQLNLPEEDHLSTAKPSSRRLPTTIEQLSASSIALPITSISSIWRLLNCIEWINLKESQYLDDSHSRTRPNSSPNHSFSPFRFSTPERIDPTQGHGSFDLANTLQHVGDILSAISSESDVEIVFYHIFYPSRPEVVESELLNVARDTDRSQDHHVFLSSDSLTGPNIADHLNSESLPSTPNLFLGAGADGEGGLREISVKADEKGLIIGLTCLLRQILYRAKRSSTIEVGLHLTPLHSEPCQTSVPKQGAVDPSPEDGPDNRHGDSSLPNGSVCTGWKCVFDVSLMPPLPPKPKSNQSTRGSEAVSSSDTQLLGTLNASEPDAAAAASHQRASIGAQLRASATLARLRMSSNMTSELPLCPEESLSKIIFERLLGMKLSTGRLTSSGHSWKVTGIFEKGIDRESDEPNGPSRRPQTAATQPQASVPGTASLTPSREPTADELTKFAETALKGKKAVFFAAEQSIFAKHITTYLTSWNIDVSHMPYEFSQAEPSSPGDAQVEISKSKVGISSTERPSTFSSSRSNTATSVPLASTASHASNKSIRSNHFIIIDDDIATLKVQLVELKASSSSSLHLSANVLPTTHQTSQRPLMSRRVKSSTQIDPFEATSKKVHTSVIHFTSISNFRKVQEIIRTHVIGTQWASIPDVLVIPKPIGPRRILTALHTAVSRPLTEHQFVPIATSPSSPGTPYYLNSNSHPLGTSQLGRASPANYLGVTDFDTAAANHLKNDVNHSIVLAGENSIAPRPSSIPTSTPPGLRTPGTAPGTPGVPSPALLSNEALEYFSKAATENGGSSSTGVVLQSPDGRPQAMFFHHSGSSNRLRSEMLSLSNHTPLQSSLMSGSITRPNSGKSKLEGRSSLSRPMAREMVSAESDQAPMTLAQQVMSGVERTTRTRSHSSTSNAGSNDLERSETSTDSIRDSIQQFTRISNSANNSILSDPPDTVFPHAMALAQYEAISPRTPTLSFPDGLYSAIQIRQNSISPSQSVVITPTAQNDHPAAPVAPSRSQNELSTLTREQQQILLNPRPLPMLRMPSIPASLPTSISVTLPSPRRPPVSQSPTTNETSSPNSGPPSSPPASTYRAGEELSRKQNSSSVLGVNEPMSTGMPRSSSAFITASKRRASMGDSMIANRLGRRRVSRKPTTALVPPINVLIVEDNRINQTILTTFMRKKSVKYDVAMNGQEAVDKWRTGSFHLVLMDLQLPVKDGIEATKEIREAERAVNINAFANTPPATGGNAPPPFVAPSKTRITPHNVSVIIVALTASSLDVDREVALAAGCNDFLTKPVSLAWLEKKLLEWGSMAWLSGFSRPALPSNSLNRSLPISSSTILSAPSSVTAGGVKPVSFTGTLAQRKAKEVAEHLHLGSDKASAARARQRQNDLNRDCPSSDQLGSDQSGNEEELINRSRTGRVSPSRIEDDQSGSDSLEVPVNCIPTKPPSPTNPNESRFLEGDELTVELNDCPKISLQVPTPERFDSFPSLPQSTSSSSYDDLEREEESKRLSRTLTDKEGKQELEDVMLLIENGSMTEGGGTIASIQTPSSSSSSSSSSLVVSSTT